VLIIIDNKISNGAKKTLSSYGEILELATVGITYSAISGHPDIFFCPLPGRLIVAPNLPEKYFEMLNSHGIKYTKGELPAGEKYPASARYNAVATESLLIHNLNICDERILQASKALQQIHVNQGYCRCNLLMLSGGHFITSDAGIFKTLQGLHPDGVPRIAGRTSLSEGKKSDGVRISPKDILLDKKYHGFFGGCCGVYKDKVFINGNLKTLPQGEMIRKFIEDLGYEIIELASDPMTDVGSIFFVE
jgi:hypothetical protein